jgi:hypothetical protein
VGVEATNIVAACLCFAPAAAAAVVSPDWEELEDCENIGGMRNGCDG